MSAKDRVLDVAEGLFSRRGYRAVSVHDIAHALGIKAASLYYHAPGGKEGLYLEVVERRLSALHRSAVEALSKGGGFRLRLLELSLRMMERGPIGLHRMLLSDVPALSAKHGRRVRRQIYGSLIAPIKEAALKAIETGELRPLEPELLAGSLLSTLDGIWYAAEVEETPVPRDALAEQWIDLLWSGIGR